MIHSSIGIVNSVKVRFFTLPPSNRYPLGVGQGQRLILARELLLAPKLNVADELVSMVDASLRATILETLHTGKTEFGITISTTSPMI